MKGPSARLPGLLESYPPFAPPHIGRTGKFNKSGPLLTLEQCRENLHAYRAAMPGRLEVLGALLGELGLDMALAYSDPVAFVRQLHPTMRAKPGCFTGLNLDPGDRNMYGYRRPCLLGLMDSLFPGPPDIFHLEEEWFDVLSRAEDSGQFALPDRVIPEAYGDVIGGPMLQRLDRYVADPWLANRMRTSWLGKAG